MPLKIVAYRMRKTNWVALVRCPHVTRLAPQSHTRVISAEAAVDGIVSEAGADLGDGLRQAAQLLIRVIEQAELHDRLIHQIAGPHPI